MTVVRRKRQTWTGLFACLSLVVLLICSTFVAADDNGIAVQIGPNHVECFYEDISGVGVKVFFHYMVTSGGSLDIGATVKGPDQKIIWENIVSTEERVLFKTRAAGRHSFCFSNRMSSVTAKIVAFSVVVAEGSGAAGTVSEGRELEVKKDPLLRSIARIQQGLHEIEEIQEFLRTRERVHRATTEVANTRVVVWSLIELIAIVAMGFASVLQLRRMFSTKRMV